MARRDLEEGGEDEVLRELGMTDAELAEERALERARCECGNTKLILYDKTTHNLPHDQLGCLACGGMFSL